MCTSFLPLNLRKRWDFPPANANPSFGALNPTLSQTPFLQMAPPPILFMSLSLIAVYSQDFIIFCVFFFRLEREKKLPQQCSPLLIPPHTLPIHFPCFTAKLREICYIHCLQWFHFSHHYKLYSIPNTPLKLLFTSNK